MAIIIFMNTRIHPVDVNKNILTIILFPIEVSTPKRKLQNFVTKTTNSFLFYSDWGITTYR